MDEILQKVIDKEEFETEDQAEEFFDEMWDKMMEYRKENETKFRNPPLQQPPGKNEFLDSKDR